jgi:hypothetical protein
MSMEAASRYLEQDSEENRENLSDCSFSEPTTVHCVCLVLGTARWRVCVFLKLVIHTVLVASFARKMFGIKE